MLQNNPDSITKYEGDGCDPLKRQYLLSASSSCLSRRIVTKKSFQAFI
ncbi:hypothetical protein CFSAN000756_01536 [Salmonella enterica subsp. enterica serovar Braenderup str. CFSAN000756]|nr:hypothetical protein CFSAN000756_01536 [Salmonella enterica subsp. enterica serovar Braenderup str. CFSAN000756]